MTGDQLTDDIGAWIQDPLVIGIAAGVILLVILLVVFVVRHRRKRRAELEQQFGAEYDRTMSQGSRREAERDLRSRSDRHHDADLRWLSSDERDRFRARFESIQASFVDSPDSAVQAADGLLDEVATARGYAAGGDHERRMSDVSVDYPEEVAAHRRGLAHLGGEDRPTTEQLRQSLLAARTLFDRLVGVRDPAPTPEPPEPLVHAPTGDATPDGRSSTDTPDTDTNGSPARDADADTTEDDRIIVVGDTGHHPKDDPRTSTDRDDHETAGGSARNRGR